MSGVQERESEADARLHQSFVERWQSISPRVRASIRRSRVEDPENSLGQVYEKAWRGYAELVAREAGGLPTNGAQADNRWQGWFLSITTHVLLDEKRQALSQRRGIGTRAWNRPFEDAVAGDEILGPSASKWEPLDVDQVIDERGFGEPAAAQEAAEDHALIRMALRQMDRAGADLLWRWGSGVPDQQVAAERSLSVRELRRQRAAALSQLAILVRAYGLTAVGEGQVD